MMRLAHANESLDIAKCSKVQPVEISPTFKISRYFKKLPQEEEVRATKYA